MPNWTETKISEKVRQNHGRGEGMEYRSWLKKKERKSSESNLNRVKGRLVRRKYELRDNLDVTALRMIEENPRVIDIREHYRLDREVTLAIADQLGIKHPCYENTVIPEVLTVNYLLTLTDDELFTPGSIGVEVAWSSKLTKEALLRLDIISLYLEHELKTPPLKVFTERETSSEIIKGFNWVASAYEISSTDFPGINLRKIQSHLLDEISRNNPNPINQVCKSIDGKLKYPTGSCLRICRAMLAHAILTVDYFTSPIGETTPFSSLSINSEGEFLS
ncbi:hypothetical protein EOPP23_14930 [Endozoicomonas sp. OPT23]|uniref:TnsA endonuclease C-terminal domain-containing protein n=1 Tax=Endozoicomonas sp. OPT23 TaxID=2072845 RepID=UPI00129ABDA9|nr:TnsA endonuclease C-terminal domain-containing protein [Endozoicomonas sp. OPT23]MRI34282.1 hypothetical protein [Endozoicomonas sp. OPT23]